MTVYCIQEPPGTAEGNPRYNVMKALSFGEVKFLFTERAQLVYSAGSLIHKLRKKLDKFNDEDFLLLVGDPAIIAVASVVASESNNGKFKLLRDPIFSYSDLMNIRRKNKKVERKNERGI